MAIAMKPPGKPRKVRTLAPVTVKGKLTPEPRKPPKPPKPPRATSSEAPKRKRGGQPKDPGLKFPLITTTVPPEVADWLKGIGDGGSASNGLRKAAISAYKAATAEAERAHEKQSS